MSRYNPNPYSPANGWGHPAPGPRVTMPPANGRVGHSHGGNRVTQPPARGRGW